MGDPISSNPAPDLPLPNSDSDADLVARARTGDMDAFDDLVGRHQDRVFNMALRILGHREDALDVSQEIFLTVFKSLPGFEAKARFGTWLYRVVVNRCRDELRRRSTVKHTRPQSLDARRPGGEERVHEPATRDPGPADGAAARETERLVEQAIAELPIEAREVLVLRDTDDRTYEEIAEILEIPLGTVRSRLNRARSLLRDRILPILERER